LVFYLISISLVKAACPSPGSGITANGTTVSENGCSIITSTTNRPGILAQANANVTLSNGTIITTGTGSEGARVSNSLVNLNNVSITTSGNSNGLFISQAGHVVMNGGSISVGGISAFGMQVVGTNSIADLNNVTLQVTANTNAAGTGLLANNISGAGVMNASNSTITVSGLTATGGFANGAGTQINLNHVSLSVNGSSSGFGLRANNGGTLNVSNGSTITTYGNLHGFFLDTGSQGIVSDTAITTNGNFAFGTYVQAASNLNMDKVTVTTSGTNSYGMLVNGSVVGTTTTATIANSILKTSGNNAIGLFLLNNSRVDLSNSTVTTTAANAPAIEMSVSGSNTATVNATNTSFNAANAMLISVDQGNANINFNHVTANAGTSQDLMTVGVDGAANLNFVANHSVLSGDIHVLNGSNAHLFFLNNTTYTGAIDPANLTIDAGSVWHLTASSRLDNLSNAGLIVFDPSGDNFKILTVHTNEIGLHGRIALNTFLGTDGSPSDWVLMDNSPSIGIDGLVITDTTGGGAPTLANGILVINTINGGITEPTAFHLAAPAVAGPYEYYLVRGAADASNTDNWYLLSTFNNPDPPSPIPPSPEIPTGQHVPFYRREVSLAAAIPSVAILYDQFVLGTLHQRVGEQEQIMGRQPPQAYLNGVWLRALKQDGTFNNNGIYYSGPSFDYSFNALQMGVDIYHAVQSNGSANFAGILGTYGQEHGNVDHLAVINAGNNNFDAWSLGGYYTHYDPRGWYIDNVLLGTFHQVNANSQRGLPPIIANADGIAASVESGYHIGLPHDFGIEPEAQVVLQRLSIDNARSNAIISFDPTNSVIGRLGARLTRGWSIPSVLPNTMTAWLFGNIWHEFQGNSRTNFSSLYGNVPFSSNIGGTSTQLGIGLTALVSHSVSIYGTGNYTSYWAGHGHSGGGELGVRFNL